LHKDYPVGTKLIINGFTINPVKDKDNLVNILTGLCNYEKKHLCDFGNKTVHTNYLGKQIGETRVDYVQNEDHSGLIGYVLLENGYFVLKIWDNIYPAEIQFDMYLDEKMLDPYIIIDHLSAPAIPLDGLGMFNYKHTLSYTTKQDNILFKNNKKNSAYKINEPFYLEEYKKNSENSKFILNELNNISCYFCDKNTNTFVFFGIPRKIISACEDHKHFGSTKELNADNSLVMDIRDLSKIFFEIIKIENTKKGYTKNVKNEQYE
jgi:hypothetical protein